MLSASFPVGDAVRKRRSVRTYDGRALEDGDRKAIEEAMGRLDNPFGVKVGKHLAEKSLSEGGEKLGTYGVVKGAKTFLGVSIPDVERAPLAAGYELESLVLFATSMGLGTVWLAATFSRDSFASAMGIPKDALFPAICPIGYPAKPRMAESIMRAAMRSSARKSWEELFFDGNFGTPLSEDAAGALAEPLELLRLAPSATNAQPWRVLKEGGALHFHVVCRPGASRDEALVRQVDMGIALSHFHLSVLESGIEGSFLDMGPSAQGAPENARYVISWQAAS